MRKTRKWQSYELMDAGDHKKVERFNNLVIERPEPKAFWKMKKSYKLDASFDKTWTYNNDKDTETTLTYDDMTFKVAINQGKQVGLFPEQAVNWDWMRTVIGKEQRPLRILNLFAYTGGASIACAMENIQELVHIDALKSANTWAKENIALNHLEDKHIRIIQEDAIKFLDREKRRGRTYDAIIMDPPSFGRGPKNEQWKIEDQLDTLLTKAVDLLSDEAVFLALNTYTTNLSSKDVLRVLNEKLHAKNLPLHTHSEEIGLTISASGNSLACGITTRWVRLAHYL